MRWPFRRKGARPGTDAADSTVDLARTPVRRPGRQWANLPPLPVTVALTAPLVTGPAPVLAPLPGPRLVFGPPVMPRTGRVDGLARAVPTSPEPPALVGPPVPAPEPPAPVVRPVHSRPPEPPAPLTQAAPQYVGEPREPAEPYRAPGWLRYTPDWLKQSAAADPLGLPVSTPEPVRDEPAKPRPVLPPRLAESPQQTEPEVVDGETSGAPVDLPPRPRRRRNLGQTRRLGLGAPLRRAPEQDLVPPPASPAHSSAEPAQEPGPAPTPSPARVPASEPPPAAEEAGGDEPPLPQPPPQPPPSPPTSRPHHPTPPVASGQPERAPTKVDLVYRSAPGRREPPQGTTRVPAGLAETIRGRHGVDVADVPVHRTPAAAAEARSLGARAFTRNAEVYLPEEAGPLDSPKAKGLLAHELVHVVQQRSLGPALPAPSTPDGAVLEAEAVAAEHEHSGHAHPDPAPLLHPSLTQVLGQAARTAGVQLAPLVPEVSRAVAPEVASAMPAAPPEITALSEPVRQDVGQISKASATRVVEQWTNPALGGTGFSTGGTTTPPLATPADMPATPETGPVDVPVPSAPEPDGPAVGQVDSAAESEMANQVLQVVNLDRATKGEPGLTALDESTMEQVRQAIAEQLGAANTRSLMFATAAASSTEPDTPAGAATAAASPGVQSEQPTQAAAEPLPMPVPAPEPAQPPAEEDSALRDGQLDLEKVDLDDLSTRLYDRLRSRLRMELLIDRERAGLLTDFR